ncbi:Myosin-crossreactive antigen [Pseudoscardovia radai]|uniref:Myosin-crossreactive antigen n=1 Tax=Pseudoscardovia radai TaxID=987066 RepID=A0A261F2R1_9BIFI|nr:oleate hydratase [Pseudoscardovia radai]OZG53353.1 Myosin-crossreactive antigen [Pseudoscardovia radai]
MYYSAGNYEAFATPAKPEGIDNKHAYIVGSGLAGLSAACFLIRDAQMPGDHITVFESLPVAGGSCDGIYDATRGYIMRGGREMDNHFEVMWDLFRSIPSIQNPGETIFSEYYKLNKDDPNFSLCRVTEKRGQDAHTDKKYAMNPKATEELLHLFLSTDEDLADKTIDDVFDDDFYKTNFWIYWQTMFAFEKWHSALEMKRYMQRYIHHIDGLPDLSALRFTRYNQYDSMIKPMVKYIEDAGGTFLYDTQVTNVVCDVTATKKVAKRIEYTQGGQSKAIDLTADDLVFVTNGSQGDCTAYAGQDTVPTVTIKNGEGPSIQLWKNIAAQSSDFGHPEKFFRSIEETSWESWTVDTANKEVLDAIEAICHRDPLSGHIVTGGIVTAKDSSWLLSWTINRQGQFPDQPDDHCLIWVYGLNCWHDAGDFVKKPMAECTGAELCEEWLYHIGVPEDRIPFLAHNECTTTAAMMPYVTSFFEPRRDGDRPKVVPDGSVNLAFVGQYAETPRDTVFTTEYSIRTGMEAVYTLCDVDRGVPEVWGSVFDLRDLITSAVKLADGKTFAEMDLPLKDRLALRELLRRVKGTEVEKLLKDCGAL